MNAPSLSGFLDITGAQFRLFDLGTALRKLPAETLHQLDQGQPYPHPHLGFAWLSIFMWNPDEHAQNSLWFLKLPLDELGILSAGVHSDLVSRLYRGLQTTDARERQRLFTDHPYQFKPDDEKMAALHARATQMLGLPASDYCAPATDFYLHHDSTLNWQHLGVQGIADMMCRAEDELLTMLNSRLGQLEEAPLIALLQQFEHRSLPTATVEALLQLCRQHSGHPAVIVAALRAACQSPARKLLLPVYVQHLQSAPNLELLLTVLTRYPEWLADEALRVETLSTLTRFTDQAGFNRIMTNLAMQPGQTGIVMQTLASPLLTAELANALSQLIQTLRGNRDRH